MLSGLRSLNILVRYDCGVAGTMAVDEGAETVGAGARESTKVAFGDEPLERMKKSPAANIVSRIT